MSIKISALPGAASAGGTDQIAANQSGTTRRVTVAQISTFINSDEANLPDFFYLPGRTGGQSAIGGDAASDGITFSTTSNATKGDYTFNTFDEMHWNAAAQGYSWQNINGRMAIRGQDSATSASLELFSDDGDSTDSVFFRAFGLGNFAAPTTNVEFLEMGWFVTDSAFHITAQAQGTGVARELKLNTDFASSGTLDQLVLNTSGSNYMRKGLKLGSDNIESFTLGGATFTPDLFLVSDEGLFDFSNGLAMTRVNAGNVGNLISYLSAQGSVGSETVSSQGDFVKQEVYGLHDGTEYTAIASIKVLGGSVAPDGTQASGEFRFLTLNAGIGELVDDAFIIKEDKSVEMYGDQVMVNATQNFTTENVGTALYTYNSSAADHMNWIFRSQVDDGTKNVAFALAANDFGGVNRHQMTFGWDAANTRYGVIQELGASGAYQTMDFSASANTYDIRIESGGGIKMDVTTAMQLIDGVQQNYEFGMRTNNNLYIQGQSAGTQANIEIFSFDGDQTDVVGLGLVGKGSPGGSDNEYLALAWNPSFSRYDITTGAGGVGADRALMLNSSGNSDMMQFNTAGTITLHNQYTLPTTNASSAGDVLTDTDASGTLAWVTPPVDSTTLQDAYDNGAQVDLLANAIVIQDNAVPIGGTLFRVSDTSESTIYLDVDANGISTTQATIDNIVINANTIDNTAADLILSSTGGTKVTVLDILDVNDKIDADHTYALQSVHGQTAFDFDAAYTGGTSSLDSFTPMQVKMTLTPTGILSTGAHGVVAETLNVSGGFAVGAATAHNITIDSSGAGTDIDGGAVGMNIGITETSSGTITNATGLSMSLNSSANTWGIDIQSCDGAQVRGVNIDSVTNTQDTTQETQGIVIGGTGIASTGTGNSYGLEFQNVSSSGGTAYSILQGTSAKFENNGAFDQNDVIDQDYTDLTLTSGPALTANYDALFNAGSAGNINDRVCVGFNSAVGWETNTDNTQAAFLAGVFGNNLDVQNNGTGTISQAASYLSTVENSTTGTISQAIGMNVSIDNTAAGTITSSTGVFSGSLCEGGTISDSVGFIADSEVAGGTMTKWTAYKAFALNDGATFTTAYLMQIEDGDFDSATNMHGLHVEQSDLDHWFEGEVAVGTGAASTSIAKLEIGAATTSLASINIEPGTAPSSPTEGDVYVDSTQDSLVQYVSGVKQYATNCLFTQSATVTVANTVTETTLTSTGAGTLALPTNFFVAAKAIRLKAYGYHSSTGNPNITIKTKFGTTVIASTGAVSSSNGTNDAWKVETDITCYTTGVSGTVWAQGEFVELHSGGAHAGQVNTATVTVDTTASQTVDLTVEWGTAAAGNTITLTNLTLEVLN